jgi:DNA polymerase III subunit epsilon
MIILDLETTGLSPSNNRITEIALIEISANGRHEEWSSLVNPDVEINSMIEGLTGITNDMVRSAPSFASLADSLYARLAGKKLVAHNAAFDYGFLQAEFERVGIQFETNTMCTVKLSKALFPQHRTHSLDALIERHALPVEGRHRALADALIVFHFLRAVEVLPAD